MTGLLTLPHLSEEREEEAEHLMHIAILNEVVGELEASLKQAKAQGTSLCGY